MRTSDVLLLGQTELTVPGGGEALVLVGALLTFLGALLGVLQFHPRLSGKVERVLDGASTAMLGIGGTAGLYVVFYSTAYEENNAFWYPVYGVGALMLVVTLWVSFAGAKKKKADKQERAHEQDDSDGGDEQFEEAGEEHVGDGAPTPVVSAAFLPTRDGEGSFSHGEAPHADRRAAGYGALGGGIAALAVLALVRRQR